MTHWHVLGAGAMGCLFAAALRDAGYPVTLLLREGHTARVTVECNGNLHHARVSSSTQATPASIHTLLVATKATQTLAALAAHQDALAAGAHVVLLQNGMGQHEAVAALLPHCHIHAGLSTEGAWLRAPFHTVHAGDGLTRIGLMHSPQPAQAATVMQALAGITLPLQWQDDIRPFLWQKLIINCAINGLTALHDCRNGELLDGGARERRLQGLCDEVWQLAQAEHIALPGRDTLFRQVRDVARDTAQNLSSTLQDIRAGRRTEIDALNGFAVSLAARHALPMPENLAILQAIHALENRLPA